MASRILSIASNSVREIVRQRLFSNVIVFGVGLLMLAVVVSNITYGYPDRVVRSIGLGGVAIATNLMSLLVGVSIVHREIEQKTLLVVLTRPVERWEYVVGRYLGLVSTLALVVFGFSVIFCLVLLYVNGTPSVQDGVALGMSFVEACVLGAFAVVLSSFSTPSLSAGIGLGFWIACASADDLVNLTEKADPGVKMLSKAIATILPNFARFNFREAAVYADPLPWGTVAWAGVYGILYAIAFVSLASGILSRREMT